MAGFRLVTRVHRQPERSGRPPVVRAAILARVTMDSKRSLIIRFSLGRHWLRFIGDTGNGVPRCVCGRDGDRIFHVLARVHAPTFRLLRPVPTLALILAGALRQASKNCLAALFGQKHQEADESEEFRDQLFHKSLVYTLQHPIFGVGPDQFSNYESNAHDKEAKSLWHPTHCSWTQVSSECGIPALIFYVCGLGSAALLVNRAYRAAHQRGYTDMANACLCYLLSMVGFYVAITFLSNAYTFYGPFLIGFAGPLSFVIKRQLSAKRDIAVEGSTNVAI